MTLSQHQQEANPEQPVSQEEPSLSKTSNATAPFSKTLSHLPRHYFNALVKPSVATYTGARGNESWSLVWIQLLAWAILDALLGVLVNLITPPATGSSFLRFFAYASSYGLVGVVPLLFFLLMGIVYLLARYFGGQGSFLEQCNTSLYIQAPLGILSKLLALIPVVGRILNTILSIYGIVLQVYVIIAVHRLSKGKAIATIVIPLVIIGVFAGAVFLLMRK
jgi:hypothetical protein